MFLVIDGNSRSEKLSLESRLLGSRVIDSERRRVEVPVSRGSGRVRGLLNEVDSS